MNPNPQFSSLPPIVQEFIDGIIHKMGYRKSVRNEVHQELTAHFSDALRDCMDPTIRQQRAESLLADFGDAVLLAQLIRRGKIRCRPWWRTAVVRSLQGVAALFILFIFYIVWFSLGRPTVRVDYLQMLNDKARPQVVDADNAWPLYDKAMSLFVKPSDELVKLKDRFADLSSQDQEAVRQWVKENQPAWDQVVAATARPYCFRAYSIAEGATSPILLGIELPHVPGVRDISRVGQRLTQIQIADGQSDKAIATSLAMIREGKQWMGQATLIEYLVGIAISAMGQDELLQTLAQVPQPAESLTKIRGELAAIWSGEYPIISFEWERLTFLDVVQNTFTEGGPGGGHLSPRAMNMVNHIMDESMPIPVAASMALIHAGRNETVKRGNEIYMALEDSIGLTPWQRKTQNLRKAEQLVDELHPYRFALLHSFVPALSRVVELYYRSKVTTEATRAVLAILEYRAGKGRWPESLAELKSAGMISSVPMDPYSDGPLMYRKDGESFMLYSRGCDFEDDGGKAVTGDLWGQNAGEKHGPGGPDGDRVFWPVH